MDSKKINKIALVSFDGNNLNEKTVNKITMLLSKKDLKKYINALKMLEQKKSLIVSTPHNNQDESMFKKLFPNKKIIFKKNPSLMLGVQIIDNDMVYEFTLKNTLDKLVAFIEQNYD